MCTRTRDDLVGGIHDQQLHGIARRAAHRRPPAQPNPPDNIHNTQPGPHWAARAVTGYNLPSPRHAIRPGGPCVTDDKENQR